MSGWWSRFRLRGLLGVIPILAFLALRQALGVTPAIIGGFGASVVVFMVNRGRAGPILALSTFALAIGAVASVAALWQGDERFYFGGDPVWDFGMAIILLGSIMLRRPLAGLITYEVLPAVQSVLVPRHPVFFVTTLIAAVMYLFHGAARLWLLLSTESIEQYLVLSRAVQWPSILLVVLLIAWMIKRSAERKGLRLTH